MWKRSHGAQATCAERLFGPPSSAGRCTLVLASVACTSCVGDGSQEVVPGATDPAMQTHSLDENN